MILGCYWAPEHMRQGDIDYMASLQPPAIRILEPDVETMNRAHHNAPGALLLPRDWALSEQHDDVRRDPVGTGIRHAQDWRGKLDGWRSQGMVAQDHQIVVVGINEPRVWDDIPSVVAYNVAFLDECYRLLLRACALNLGVGWPANTGPDTPPDWTPYEPVRAAIHRGNHFLCVHEYWYRSGPLDGAGWWAWRINKCPWDVPIIIGETGVDNYVDTERWRNEGEPPRGWLGNINPDHYAAQMVQYAQGLDKRVHAILPFLTDYRSNQWQSFDTEQAHNAFLARRNEMQPKAIYTVRLPIVTVGTPPADVVTDPPATRPDIFLPSKPDSGTTNTGDNWRKSREFVARWEGGFADHPADKGGPTNKGVTISTFRKWRALQGMGEPSVDDLRNLSDEEADALYHQLYWVASGAAIQPWPQALVTMDTAVLHGVEAAKWFNGEVGGSALGVLGLRLLTYAASIDREPSQAAFWQGWRNRTMQLRAIVRQAAGQPV